MRLNQDKGMPIWLLGVSACMVYVAASLLAGREFTTIPGELFVLGCLFGVFKAVPLLGFVLAAQFLFVWLARRRSRATRLLLCGVPPVALLCATVAWTCRPVSEGEKLLGFQAFFSERPPSVQVLAYGYSRGIASGGRNVLLFRVSEEVLLKMMQQEAYGSVAINSEPSLWRPSLYNPTIAELSHEKLEVDASFDCYSKSTATNRARVFYDPQRSLAVFVGYGTYNARTWGVRARTESVGKESVVE